MELSSFPLNRSSNQVNVSYIKYTAGIRHKCRYCEREFCDTSNRKRHEISVHINMTRDFICDTCGKSYRTAWMLRSHVKVKHEGHILKKDRKLPSQCHVSFLHDFSVSFSKHSRFVCDRIVERFILQ